ncbi:hypothetical protein acsn021_37460 [Anaerocolumna cellulosilytica]|uniref:Uncharacterized protein n=1 Tax=Anaerocolumna cellulosilytica TaxID=433286 RepID=A0A6S6R7Z5_9FIRM|nr:hypothetical protein [Anaerocolumna cellulosilytica]BCJ96177.1 hypothetical protein acsn021_37460 [Anaerocolumna cellulosilytica]
MSYDKIEYVYNFAKKSDLITNDNMKKHLVGEDNSILEFRHI